MKYANVLVNAAGDLFVVTNVIRVCGFHTEKQGCCFFPPSNLRSHPKKQDRERNLTRTQFLFQGTAHQSRQRKRTRQTLGRPGQCSSATGTPLKEVILHKHVFKASLNVDQQLYRGRCCSGAYSINRAGILPKWDAKP